MANEQNLKPFKKGDKRINRKGRPKSFDALRQLAQTIAHEDISDGMTVTEAILRKWAGSKDPRLQMAFIEYAFGKPPQKTENVNVDFSNLTDDQLTRIAAGEDVVKVVTSGSISTT